MRKVTRPDYAPSRLKYRLERWMLTPSVRFFLRFGLPVIVTTGLGALWFSSEANRDSFAMMISDVRAAVESRPEFQVDMMAIDGAATGVAEDIREVLSVDFPRSSFDLDLPQMQDDVVGLDAVKKARLRIEGNVLRVEVTERLPAVLWRHAEGLELLDAKGVLVGPADSRAAYADLPVLAGEGASEAVPEALELFRVAGPLTGRLRGFERMGARRWDVVLDRGQRILLPETGAVKALERAIAMDQAVDMLARDLVAVDLRLPRRPTVRVSQHAVEEFWRIKAIEAGGEQKQ